VCEVKAAVALVLERGADLLEAPDRDPRSLRDAQANLTTALRALETGAMAAVPRADADPSIRNVVSGLDPAFRAQEEGFIAS
jgi:hypothetical protein